MYPQCLEIATYECGESTPNPFFIAAFFSLAGFSLRVLALIQEKKPLSNLHFQNHSFKTSGFGRKIFPVYLELVEG